MKATNELRFVERAVQVAHPRYEHVTETRMLRILQQKWAGYVSTGPLKIDVNHREEWRDVPIEKEPKQ